MSRGDGDARSALLDEAVAALDEVANPIKYLRQRAEADGSVLNAMALQIADDPAHLKRIAATFLARINALEKGEGK